MHTDRFTPLDAATLLRWMQHDLPNKQLFGIDRELFFMPKPDDPFRMERYGKVLETPLGVAAGPHTQLAQNIVASYVAGSRFFELKTVQVMDGARRAERRQALHRHGRRGLQLRMVAGAEA